MHYLCLESCLQVNQPDEIRFYYHHEPYGEWWKRIKPKLTLVRVQPNPLVSLYRYEDPYIQLHNYAHHTDFIRLELLIEHGGVYADMDTLFVNRLPEHLFDQACVLGEEDPIIPEHETEPVESLCNAFIMAEQSSEFCRKWHTSSYLVFDGSWSRHSCIQARVLSRTMPHAIHVEPKRSFYKHSWTKEGLETLLLGLDLDYEHVYSFHLWSHLWFDQRRQDFTDFHGGQLTETFIREVDTTYNVIARQFLP